MTTIPKLATYNIPHRNHRAGVIIESFDCGIAPLDDEQEAKDQETMRRDFEWSIYRQCDIEDKAREKAEEITQDMSALGRDLFEFGARLSRAQAKGEL